MDKELLDMVTKEQLDRTEIDRIRMLIQEGANLNDTDPADGTTLLYHACRNGHLEVVVMLLEISEEMIDHKNSKDGSTPLYVATQGGHIDVVKVLIQHHANMNLAKETGATPLWVARHKELWDIVDILEEEQENQPLPYNATLYRSKMAEKRRNSTMKKEEAPEPETTNKQEEGQVPPAFLLAVPLVGGLVYGLLSGGDKDNSVGDP